MDIKTSDLKHVESRHIVVGSVTPIYVLKAGTSKIICRSMFNNGHTINKIEAQLPFKG